MNFITAIVSLMFLLTFSLGVLVYARAPRSRLNRSFAISAAGFAIWMAANYFGSNFKEEPWSLWLIKLDFLLGPFIAFLFFMIVDSFSEKRNFRSSNQKLRNFVLVISLFNVLFGLSSSVVEVSYINGKSVIDYGQNYLIFGLIFLLNMGIAFGLTIYKYRKSEGELKARLGNLLFVVFVMIVVVAATNIFVPLLTDSEQINRLSGNLAYLGPTFFVIFSFYSLFKREFFDVRLATARIVAYLVSLALLLIFSILVFIVFIERLAGVEFATQDYIIIILSNILAALSYNPLKNFFSFYSQRIFRSYNYKIDVAIKELNQVFIGQIKTDSIATRSFEIIEKYAKPSFIALYITAEGIEKTHTYFDTTESGVGLVHVETLDSVRFKNDEYIADSHDKFYRKGISHIFRLKNSTENIGYLVVGHKDNGAMFNKTDERLLSIYADNLVLALTNSLNFRRITEFNVTLKDQIEAATNRLKRTNEELTTTSVAKDEFISMAAHQLRPQLAAVRGFVDLLSNSKIDSKQKDLLNWTATGTERMIRIITDMLNLSKITSGEFTLNPTKVNLVDLVQNELTVLSPLLTTTNMSIQFIHDKPKACTIADELKLREVIANLLSNAVQYSDKAKSVEVRIQNEQNGWSFRVRDFGIGVEPKEASRLFEKYFRTTTAIDTRPSGTGVGLFLAKKVVELHNGKVFYEKPAEGQGSIFGFWLPELKADSSMISHKKK